MTSEQEIQVSVVAWLDLALPSGSLRHHSPNESLARPQYRKKQNRMGLKKGWPDLELFIQSTWFKEGKPWSPIFIELKSAKGRLSPHQKEVLALLEEAGCHVAVCRSLDEVREFLSEIIELKCD
jgi:hypothetical protein